MKIIASKSLPTPAFSLTSLTKVLRLLKKYFKMGMTVAHFLSSSGGIHEKLEKSKTCNWRNKKPSFLSRIFNLLGGWYDFSRGDSDAPTQTF